MTITGTVNIEKCEQTVKEIIFNRRFMTYKLCVILNFVIFLLYSLSHNKIYYLSSFTFVVTKHVLDIIVEVMRVFMNFANNILFLYNEIQ